MAQFLGLLLVPSVMVQLAVIRCLLVDGMPGYSLSVFAPT